MTRDTPDCDVSREIQVPAEPVPRDNAVNLALAGNVSDAIDELVETRKELPEAWQDRYHIEQLRSWQSGSRLEDQRIKVAIVSLLFNWPSQGGGTVHTAETGKFLEAAGYEVEHLFAVYEPWQIGRISEQPLCRHTPIHFDVANWNSDEIKKRFRAHLRAFQPDFVIVTDSWNTKPLLCEAAADWPYIIRLAAQECICPLNNVRLLVRDGGFEQCDGNQLGDADRCRQCLVTNAHLSGSLHRDERALADVVGGDYEVRLQSAFQNAEAVFAVNDEIAELARPFSGRVEVVPSGFDTARFPEPTQSGSLEQTRILFAGVTHEAMKGFGVLKMAAELLWARRRDFTIVATGDNVGEGEDYCEFVGWHSQSDLPGLIDQCDVLVFPTVAQDALGRTAVEAMAMGLPVVASRLGGLKTTVVEGETGLLFEPGDHVDLARQLESLLDNPAERTRLGNAGRQKFESEFSWDVIIKRHYEPLFGSPLSTPNQDSLSCV